MRLNPIIESCFFKFLVIFMHIDSITTVLFNVVGALLMSAGLFAVSRGYLGEIKGLRRWSIALLSQAIGWILIALAKTINDRRRFYILFVVISLLLSCVGGV